MKNFSLIIIMLAGFVQFSCSQNQLSQSEWLTKNTLEFQPNGTYDFSGLKDVLKNRRIVAIGESTHGLGEFYAMKSALVMYLHKELGYDILAMEAGLGDINLAYTDIDSISPKNLRDYTLFGNFKAKEVDTLFSYIKQSSTTKKPLIYTGYDTQFSSDYFMIKLKRLLEPLDKTMADSLSNRMYAFQKSFRASRQHDSVGYIKYRDIYIKNAIDIGQLLQTKKDSLIRTNMISNMEYLIIRRTLDMFVRSTDLSYEDRFQGYQLRDKLMAENLTWLLDEIYPEAKVIIWAHNGHIEKSFVEGYDNKLMGHYLKERYGEDYYSLGLFAYEGEAYEHWTANTVPFKNNDSTAIEFRFMNIDKDAPFLDLSNIKPGPSTQWLFEPVTGFELENGRNIRFIPTKRFDGIISIKHSGIPTYNRTN
ncbi:hypothetical protein GWK08_08475 [Leptobacterium flavescens]|uniref:Erythromycin esterase family protein n=1 Tax=Leptobacterium flavescens TaxID=472055 RepID=A0A6P0UNJ1_9FLAO|nr:erythromycin esterase family protein [Leptobacterium flavescens]NER13468.1 hypothetical protein [Leptobacterium flavescens]